MAKHTRSLAKRGSLFVTVLCLGFLVGCEPGPPVLQEVTPQSGYRAEGAVLPVSGKVAREQSFLAGSEPLTIELMVFRGNESVRREIINSDEEGYFGYDIPLFEGTLSPQGKKVPLKPGDFRLEIVARDAQGRTVSSSIRFSIPDPLAELDKELAAVDSTDAAALEGLKAKYWGIPEVDRSAGWLASVGKLDGWLAGIEEWRARERTLDAQLAGVNRKSSTALNRLLEGYNQIPAAYRSARWSGNVDVVKRLLAEPVVKPEPKPPVVKPEPKPPVVKPDPLAELERALAAVDAMDAVALEKLKAKYEAIPKGERSDRWQAGIGKVEGWLTELRRWSELERALDAQLGGVSRTDSTALKGLQGRYAQVPAAYRSAGWSANSGKLEGMLTELRRWNDIQRELIDVKLQASLSLGQLADSNAVKEVVAGLLDVPSEYRLPYWKISETRADSLLRALRTVATRVPCDRMIQFIHDSIRKGELKIALGLLGAIDDPACYMAARWNIALLSLTEEQVRDVDKALVELEQIGNRDRSVYVSYYRGLAYYLKARSRGDDILETIDAQKDYEQVIDALELAQSRKSEFSTTKLNNVPLPSPQKHITELNYYLGMSYYFLYKIADYEGEDELIEKYKGNSRSNLYTYLNLNRVMDPRDRDPGREAEVKSIYNDLK